MGTLGTLLNEADQRMSRGAEAERLLERIDESENEVFDASLLVRIDWTSFHLKPFGLTVLRDALAAQLPGVTTAA